MSSGLYSGVSGIALGSGLYRNVSGLWSGASGLVTGFGGSNPYGGASLYLDFLAMTAANFDSRITFSRGTNATLVGANGLVQYAPSNLLAYSEQFDNAAWFKGNTTVTANTAVAPDGSTTADTVTFTAVANANIQPNTAITVTTGAAYTFSVYVRAASAVSNVKLSMQGTDTAIAVDTAWTRVSMTVTASGATLAPTLVTRDSVASTIFVWGAQLEPGTTATTYNSTSVKNLLGYSEAFDNAAWTKSNSSIVTGAAANPINGLFTAQKLMEDTSTGVHRTITALTMAAIPYTMSVYAKAAGRNWIAVGNASDNQFAYFNLATGAVGTLVGTVTAAITSIGNGWYRCSVTATPTAASRVLAIWVASADNTASYTGDGNSGVYIYGAQLSDSASLDPYVPTPGAAPTSAAYYGPRFDYDPITLAAKGLLIEEARTNLLLNSGDLTSYSILPATGLTSTANATTAPDGTATARRITNTVTTEQHRLYQNQTLTATTAYTYTAYLKNDTAGWAQISFFLGTAVTAFANINLATGALGTTGGGTSYSVTPAGNGWYRLRVTATTEATACNVQLYVLEADSLVANPTTTGTVKSIYVWGAQLEAGAFATSYIPTVASTVTRSADVATMTGTNFSSWYNQSAGTFVVAGDYVARINWRRFMTADDSASPGNNRMIVNADQDQQLLVTTGGVSQATLSAGTAPAANTVTKIASTYNLNDFAAARDGGAVATDTSGTVPTVNRLNFGLHPNGSEYLNGHIQTIAYFNTRLANAQLQSLTA